MGTFTFGESIAQSSDSTYVWPIEHQIANDRNYYRNLIHLICAQMVLDKKYKIHTEEYSTYRSIDPNTNIYRITVYDSIMDRRFNISLLQFKNSTSSVMIITDPDRPSFRISSYLNGLVANGKGANNIDPNDPIFNIKRLEGDGYSNKIKYIMELARKQMLKNI